MDTLSARIAQGRRILTRLVVDWLVSPVSTIEEEAPAQRADLEARLEPGDVILVAGRTRFSRLVCRMTQSSWSHVAIYVGRGHDAGATCTVVEADIEAGVRLITLAELADCRIQVVRASRLPATARDGLARHLLDQVGRPYDLAHVFLLARLLIVAPLPASRWLMPRQVHRADPSRAICSTLVAHALFAAGVTIGASPLLAPRLQAAGKPEATDAAAVLDYLVPGDFARLPDFEPVFDSREA